MNFPGKKSAPLPLSLFAIQPILALPEKVCLAWCSCPNPVYQGLCTEKFLLNQKFKVIALLALALTVQRN